MDQYPAIEPQHEFVYEQFKEGPEVYGIVRRAEASPQVASLTSRIVRCRRIAGKPTLELLAHTDGVWPRGAIQKGEVRLRVPRVIVPRPNAGIEEPQLFHHLKIAVARCQLERRKMAARCRTCGVLETTASLNAEAQDVVAHSHSSTPSRSQPVHPLG